MILEINKCLKCDKRISGRTDKKFCGDYCRNSYNNKKKKNKIVIDVNALAEQAAKGFFPIAFPEATNHLEKKYNENMRHGIKGFLLGVKWMNEQKK